MFFLCALSISARRVPFPLLVLDLGVGEDKEVVASPDLLFIVVFGGLNPQRDDPRKDSKSQNSKI